jgi:hypothetical protein
MPHGEPQLEPAEAVQVPLPAEPSAVPLQPETAAPMAAPLGARGNEAAGMREVMALASPGERRRFILQLQRTAGNAAVCLWLSSVRDRYAARHGSPDDPPDVDEPRAR